MWIASRCYRCSSSHIRKRKFALQFASASINRAQSHFPLICSLLKLWTGEEPAWSSPLWQPPCVASAYVVASTEKNHSFCPFSHCFAFFSSISAFGSSRAARLKTNIMLTLKTVCSFNVGTRSENSRFYLALFRICVSVIQRVFIHTILVFSFVCLAHAVRMNGLFCFAASLRLRCSNAPPQLELASRSMGERQSNQFDLRSDYVALAQNISGGNRKEIHIFIEFKLFIVRDGSRDSVDWFAHPPCAHRRESAENRKLFSRPLLSSTI